MSSPESRHFHTGPLRLHYLDWGGKGSPLLLLHGGSAHARWWDFVAPLLTHAFRVFALDLRGHGESDWCGAGGYAVEDYCGDVARMLESLSLDHPVLAGHSLGAFVALRYAVDHPRALAALVLVDGRAEFSASSSRYFQLLRILAPGEYATLEEAVEKFRPLPKETSARPRVLEHVARQGFRRNGSGRWVGKFDRASLASHRPFDFRSRLGDIEFPVLVVRGERSPMLSARSAAKLAAACKRGVWAEIPGAYHHVLLDRPEELSREILKFLTVEPGRHAKRGTASPRGW